MPLIGGSAAAVDLTPYLQKAGGEMTGPHGFDQSTVGAGAGLQSFYNASYSQFGFNFHSNNKAEFGSGASPVFSFGFSGPSAQLILPSNGILAFSSSSVSANQWTTDVNLTRAGAGSIFQQYGTVSQSYALARTVTGGGADWESVKLGWSGTTANLVTEAGGAGTERGINICANGASLGFFEVGPVSQPATTNIAETAHALSGSYTQAEIEAALDSLGTCINQLKGTLEALGLQAAS